jgi:hypothetical protein
MHLSDLVWSAHAHAHARDMSDPANGFTFVVDGMRLSRNRARGEPHNRSRKIEYNTNGDDELMNAGGCSKFPVATNRWAYYIHTVFLSDKSSAS